MRRAGVFFVGGLVAACAIATACSSFNEDTPAPGDDGGTDATMMMSAADAADVKVDVDADAGMPTHFCALFDATARCADFDDAAVPYGPSFMPEIAGDGSTLAISEAEAMHPSPALVATTFTNPDGGTEARILVRQVPVGAKGVQIDADMEIGGTAGANGAVIQVVGYHGGVVQSGAYTVFSNGGIYEASFAVDGGFLSSGGITTTLQPGWAHFSFVVTPGDALNPTQVSGYIVIGGVMNPTGTVPLPANVDAIDVLFGPYPNPSAIGNLVTVIDNVVVRPR